MAEPVPVAALAAIALSRIQELAHWFRTLRAGRRVAAMVAAGALTALAFAPFYLWPVCLFSFPALAWTLDGCAAGPRKARNAAIAAWAFGFGYFLAGLHWIGFAFLVDAERHAWLLPFVAPLFPGGLALFFAAAGAVSVALWRPGVERLLWLAVSLAVLEWLRGHILTGFPWNVAGYVWGGSDIMIQTASVFGIYGLTLVTLTAFLAPAAMVAGDGKGGVRAWPLFVPVMVVLALFAFGWLRVPAGAQPLVPGVALRQVQPDVPQNEKWKPEFLSRNWRLLVDLTRSPGLETRSHVIWPEAAPPFLLTTTDGALDAVAELLPDSAMLLSGTQRHEPGDPPRFFNSMAAIDGRGRVLATYDKSHLVPFGEYLPFFKLLKPLGITQLTGRSGGFTEGDGPVTLDIAGAPPFTPLICYEIIFPGAVTGPGARPQWLVNMTDDSWFGPWTGPFQHLGIARVRAVEEGLPVARAANTGVSAVIDPFGRVIASLGLDHSGIVDAPLPQPLGATIFSFAGDAIFLVMILFHVGGALFFQRYLFKSVDRYNDVALSENH